MPNGLSAILQGGWFTPAPVAEVLEGFIAEVQLGKSKHLLIGQGINVDADVGNDLRGDLWAVFFDVGHEVVGGVRPALPMTQKQDQCRGRERVADLAPVLLAVGLIGPSRVARTVGNLVVIALGIVRDDAGGALAWGSVGRVEDRVAEVDGSHDAFAPERPRVCAGVGHGQTSWPAESTCSGPLA